MPGGGIGAKWGGLVFPLRDDASIEITDTGVPPASCTPWRPAPDRWWVQPDPQGTACYVFLTGDAALRDQAVQALTAPGVRVLRSGPNLSGADGDWFLRLDPVGRDLGPILDPLLGPLPAERPDDTLLRERLLIEALEQAAASRAQWRREAEAALAGSNVDKALQARLNAEIEALTARLEAAEAELHQRRAAPPEPRPDPAPRSGKSVRIEQELALAARMLLPRLTLLAGSASFIAVELPDRTSIWNVLAALERQERGQPAGWKPVVKHAGWWERHFSTGQDDQGRVYAKLTPDGWQVLVSHKQNQKADFRNLSDMA